MVMDLQFCESIKNYWIVHFKCVNHVVCELYLNKLFFINEQVCSLYIGTESTISSVQFSSVTQSCPTLCDPINLSTPDLPVHHQLPEFTQTHVHWVCDASLWCDSAISSSVVPFSSCPQSLPASESFLMSQLFAWGGQSTGVSVLALFLPKKTQADLL